MTITTPCFKPLSDQARSSADSGKHPIDAEHRRVLHQVLTDTPPRKQSSTSALDIPTSGILITADRPATRGDQPCNRVPEVPFEGTHIVRRLTPPQPSSTAHTRAADRPIMLDRMSVEGCPLPPARWRDMRVLCQEDVTETAAFSPRYPDPVERALLR